MLLANSRTSRFCQETAWGGNSWPAPGDDMRMWSTSNAAASVYYALEGIRGLLIANISDDYCCLLWSSKSRELICPRGWTEAWSTPRMYAVYFYNHLQYVPADLCAMESNPKGAATDLPMGIPETRGERWKPNVRRWPDWASTRGIYLLGNSRSFVINVCWNHLAISRQMMLSPRTPRSK